MTGLEGVVDDRGDEGTYGGDVGFYEGCGEGVEGAGGGFHLSDEDLDLMLGGVSPAVERLGDRWLWGGRLSRKGGEVG